MTKDEALKLALEALEADELDMVDDGSGNMVFRKEQAITAIKEALAQPEQEPVGQLLEDAFGRGQVMWFNKPKDESMLYTTPQSEKYPQIAINPEIVGYVAPQRKPLTDEQRFDLLTKFEPYKNKWGAPAILIDMVEAAHGIKDKNTQKTTGENNLSSD